MWRRVVTQKFTKALVNLYYNSQHYTGLLFYGGELNIDITHC
jgi:hypothetical protein